MKSRSDTVGLIIMAAVILLGVVGYFLTPVNEKGQPILLLPDVKKVEDYRRKASTWTEKFQVLDGKLAVLVSGNSNNLYSQSKDSQDLFEEYVKLTREIEDTEAPASLTGLKSTLLDTSDAYLAATQSALRWVSDPTPDNLSDTQALIETAQEYLSSLESNTWILNQ